MKNIHIIGVIFYLIILAGVFSRNPLLLGCALPFFFYLLPGLFAAPTKMHLSLTRTLSCDRALDGDIVEVTNRITNIGETRLEEIHIEDHMPGNLDVIEGASKFIGFVEQGEQIELNYTVKVTHGYYQFNMMTVNVIDHFDIFRKVISLSDSKDLTVLPNVKKLVKMPLQLRRSLLRPGSNLARIRGSGTQFFEVREFHQGDSLRHINWHAYAKYPHSFFTNAFEEERVADIGLILDERKVNYPWHAQSKYLGYAVDATAILADTLLAAGNRVGMLIYGNYVNWTFPGYGKYQQEKIFHALSKAKEGNHQAFAKMDNIPTRYFPPKSQIIIISPIRLKDIPTLIQLHARRYELIVVLPNFTSILFQDDPSIPHQAKIKRMMKIEKKMIINKLIQNGIFVIDWDVCKSFEHTIHEQLIQFQVWNQHRRWS